MSLSRDTRTAGQICSRVDQCFAAGAVIKCGKRHLSRTEQSDTDKYSKRGNKANDSANERETRLATINPSLLAHHEPPVVRIEL
jgi:hypothetical protein